MRMGASCGSLHKISVHAGCACPVHCLGTAAPHRIWMSTRQLKGTISVQAASSLKAHTCPHLPASPMLSRRWVLLQLVAVTAAFLWHTPDFCRHHASCGLLACHASYSVALVAVAAAIAWALTSAKQPSRFWSWRLWRHQ